MDRLAPVKIVQVRKNYAPWVSDQTKEVIKLRNEAQKKASETQNDDDGLTIFAIKITISTFPILSRYQRDHLQLTERNF